MKNKKKLKQLFSAEEEAYILNNYLVLNYQEIADKLNCKRHNVVYFLKRNGLEGEKRKLQLNEEQMLFLKNNYRFYSKKELASIFKIPENSISYYVKILNLNGSKKANNAVKPLSDADKKYILDNYLYKTYAEISDVINSNVNQVRRYISMEGLSGNKHWNTKKDEYLKNHYLNKTDKEISSKILHSESAVFSRRMKLGLKKESDIYNLNNSPDKKYKGNVSDSFLRSNKHWSKDEIDYLENNYLLKSDKELSLVLNRSPKSIKHQRVKFGWKRSTYRSNYEIEIENFLKENAVDYDAQFQLNGYVFDFKIKNTLIEFNGDYYHCNPDIYINGPINKDQLYTTIKDKEKIDSCLNSNYKILIIWEKDYLENKLKILNSLLAVS